MTDENDVNVSITGSVDPSLATSTNAAKAQILDLGTAANSLSVAQRSLAQAVLEGRLSLDALSQYLGKTSEAKQALAAITVAVTQAQHAETTSAEEAAAAQTTLSEATIAGMERAAQYEATAFEKRRTDMEELAALQARQAGYNFAQDVNAATGVGISTGKSARDSAQVFIADEKAKKAALDAEIAAQAAAAQTAERAAVAESKIVTSTVPLYAAKQRLSAAIAAANARLAAGTITERENEAAVAAATNTYNRKIEALLKSGAAIQVETGEIVANTAVTEANTAAGNANAFSKADFFKKLASGRSVYEGEAAARAILTGNMGRLASAMAVESTRLDILKYAFTPVGLAVTAVAAAMIAGVVATYQYEEAQRKLIATTLGVGAASGLTADQLQESADIAAQASGQSSAAALKEAEAFAGAGIRTQSTITALSADVQTYAALTGGKAADAQKELARAMEDPAKGAEEINKQLGILNGTQLEQIRTLQAAGDKEGAVAIITAALQHRVGEAHQAGIGLNNEFQNLAAGASNLWSWLGKVNEQLLLFQQFGFASGGIQAKQKSAAAAAQAQAAQEARNNIDSQRAMAVVDTTPMGEEITRYRDLQTQAATLKTRLDELRSSGQQNSVEFQRENAAYNALHDTIGRVTSATGQYITQSDRQHSIVTLEIQMAAATKAHDAALRGKLATQIALLKAGEQVRTNEDVQRAAQDQGGLAAAKTRTGGGKGPGAAQEWAEQLHAEEIQSNDFFGDQTKRELEFWQSKVGLTRQGSHDWLEVQSRIYDAQKKLAHDAYDAHLAELAATAEADKNNWDKYKTDLQAEADFILKTYKGDTQVKAYQDKLKEIEEAEREHERVMREIARTNAEEGLAELKSTLAANKAIREENAKEAESEIQFKAKYSINPLAQVQAEQQIAAIRRQTSQQNIADMEQEHVAADKLLQDDIEAAKDDAAAYTKAVDAKKLADLQFTNQHRELMNQMVNQDRADAQKMAQTWHSVVDPMVQTTGTQIKGLIEGTESWGQAIRKIGEQALDVLIQKIEEWVEAQIVAMIMGKTTQATTAASQIGSYAAVAGAAGTASWAGAPFPIDTGAPAFGAAMAMNAMSYMSLVGLATGTNYVPDDMVQLIHEGERVVPKADNTALMSMLAGRSNGAGGDFHGDFGVHLHGVGAPSDLDGKAVVRALEKSQTHFSRLLKNMHRSGHFAYVRSN